MNCQISTMIDLPESLHEALQQWLDRHPGVNQSSAIADALNLFLLSEAKSNA